MKNPPPLKALPSPSDGWPRGGGLLHISAARRGVSSAAGPGAGFPFALVVTRPRSRGTRCALHEPALELLPHFILLLPGGPASRTEKKSLVPLVSSYNATPPNLWWSPMNVDQLPSFPCQKGLHWLRHGGVCVLQDMRARRRAWERVYVSRADATLPPLVSLGPFPASRIRRLVTTERDR